VRPYLRLYLIVDRWEWSWAWTQSQDVPCQNRSCPRDAFFGFLSTSFAAGLKKKRNNQIGRPVRSGASLKRARPPRPFRIFSFRGGKPSRGRGVGEKAETREVLGPLNGFCVTGSFIFYFNVSLAFGFIFFFFRRNASSHCPRDCGNSIPVLRSWPMPAQQSATSAARARPVFGVHAFRAALSAAERTAGATTRVEPALR